MLVGVLDLPVKVQELAGQLLDQSTAATRWLVLPASIPTHTTSVAVTPGVLSFPQVKPVGAPAVRPPNSDESHQISRDNRI